MTVSIPFCQIPFKLYTDGLWQGVVYWAGSSRSRLRASSSKRSTTVGVLICGMCPRQTTCILPKSVLDPSLIAEETTTQWLATPQNGKSDTWSFVDFPRYRNNRSNRNVLYKSFYCPPLSPPIPPAWHGTFPYLVEVRTMFKQLRWVKQVANFEFSQEQADFLPQKSNVTLVLPLARRRKKRWFRSLS